MQNAIRSLIDKQELRINLCYYCLYTVAKFNGVYIAFPVVVMATGHINYLGGNEVYYWHFQMPLQEDLVYIEHGKLIC